MVFKRYLISVESHVEDMDKLLDLVYAMEGLFEKMHQLIL